jgi:hypothetical protein
MAGEGSFSANGLAICTAEILDMPHNSVSRKCLSASRGLTCQTECVPPWLKKSPELICLERSMLSLEGSRLGSHKDQHLQIPMLVNAVTGLKCTYF